jgi:heme-degrading monooxygenase HmoA
VSAQPHHVMASRLRLSSPRHLPRFLRASTRVGRQAREAPGCIDSRLRAQLRSLTFWTLSAWEDEAAMKEFVRSEPHLGAMRDLRARGAVASAEFRSWVDDAAVLPDWDAVTPRFDGSTER